MRIAGLPARLNRAQKSRAFKVVSSIVVVALLVAAFSALWVAANAPGAETAIAQRQLDLAEAQQRPEGLSWMQKGPLAVARQSIDAMLISLNANQGLVPVVTSFLLVGGIGLAVIWLGLGLSYLGLFLLGLAVAWPLSLFGPTAGLGRLVMGAVPLTLMFLVLMELLRVALSGGAPVLAVARNVLSEAVRMKISLVFIVLLILMMAVVPGLLNDEQPLRYRVQQWLSYGTGLSYAILALMTVFFAAATVAFEQRDRVIWQTMSKPVRPWQYLLGKWVGVVSLNAVLLAVTSGGVYLFTEYLRHLPAEGEMAYHVRADDAITRDHEAAKTEDRRLLETQVLVARRSMLPDAPRFVAEAIDQAVQERVVAALSREPDLADTEPLREDIRRQLITELMLQSRTIEQMGYRDFEFTGLRELRDNLQRVEERIRQEADRRLDATPEEETEEARQAAFQAVAMEMLRAGVIKAPPTLTLRYKINAGTNDPTALYRVGFLINGQPFERQVGVKSAQTLSFPSAIIDDDGLIQVRIFNFPNERDDSISFPPDGLEILYAAGGYESNFARVMAVAWLKLAFIAAVAISAATFLSFPVACLFALVVLFAAESSAFLLDSLENYYFSKDAEGNIKWGAVVVRAVAVPISHMFEAYSKQKPTESLVDGRLVSWLSLARTMMILGLWSLGTLAAGWLVFRRRELATYSGQ